MSRFSESVLKGEYDQKSLSTDDIERIIEILVKKIALNREKIEDTICFFAQKSLNYHIYNLDDEVVLVMRRSKLSSLSLSIGYPFPLHTFRKIGSVDNMTLDFYIRGKIVRDSQRNHLIKKLEKKYEVICVNECDKTSFKETFKKKTEKYRNATLAYYDMYRFIGDSIINTWMVDEFIAYFEPQDFTLLSRNYLHLSTFYKSENFDDYKQLKKYDVIVLADLIDISNGEAQNIICETQRDGLYILLSRNLFIEKKGNTIVFYYNDSNYTLFNTQNIYPYMKSIINDFFDSKNEFVLSSFRKRYPILKTIFFNPYASLMQKSLSYEESVMIIEKIKMLGYDVLIPYGHTNDTMKTSKMISERTKCEMINSQSISELADLFIAKNLTVITVDSAISHLAAKCNNYCITLFREGFWDKYSLQSLCNESPIGFCSYCHNQLPLILNDIEMAINQLSTILRIIYSNKIEPINSTRLYDIVDDSLSEKLQGEGIELDKLELEYKLRIITGEYDVL